MNKLKENQKVPSFSAVDYKGERINLDEFRAEKVLLSFHVFASCPFCNLRVNEIKNKVPEWRSKGLEVIHVFSSTGVAISRYAGKDNPSFRIIADPEKKIYGQYGISKSILGMMAGFFNVRKLVRAFKVVGMVSSLRDNDAAMHQLPADFLIDESGVIRKAYYSKANGDNLPLDQIDAFIAIEMMAA